MAYAAKNVTKGSLRFPPPGLPFEVAPVVNVVVAALASDFPLTLFGMASGTGILQSM